MVRPLRECASDEEFFRCAQENSRVSKLPEEDLAREILFERMQRAIASWGVRKADVLRLDAMPPFKPATYLEKLKRILCAVWNFFFGRFYPLSTEHQEKERSLEREKNGVSYSFWKGKCPQDEASFRDELKSFKAEESESLLMYLDAYRASCSVWQSQWETSLDLFKKTFFPLNQPSNTPG